MNIRRLFALSCLLIAPACFLSYRYLTQLHHVVGANPTEKVGTIESPLGHKSLLLLNTVKGYGGGEIYTLALRRNLEAQGVDVTMLVMKDKQVSKRLDEEGVSYYAVCTPKFGFVDNIKYVIEKKDINLIHCNTEREAVAAKKAAAGTSVKVVLTKHVPNSFPPSVAGELDGLIAVSKQIQSDMLAKNKAQDLKIKNIAWISPFFEEEKFLRKPPSLPKAEFFAQHFGIELDDAPIVTSITNFSRDKNPHLLVKAIAYLRHQRGIKINALFVGRGNQLFRVKRLAMELSVYDCCHFIGYTDRVAEVLHFADVHALTSKQEGLGMTLLEAAMLKKPLIATEGTGAMDVVMHEKTGIVIENNNPVALAEAIELLVESPLVSQNYGILAYEHTRDNFSIAQNMKRILKLYKKVLAA